MGRDATRDDFRWWTSIATRWMDGDPYGHVNNVIYYSWFDTAATSMMMERGVLGPDLPAIGLCVESACAFHAPVSFPQRVDAGVRIGRMGDKSVRYEIGLFVEGRAEPAATGHFVHVFVDRATRRPVPIAPAHRDALRDLVVDDDDAAAAGPA